MTTHQPKSPGGLNLDLGGAGSEATQAGRALMVNCGAHSIPLTGAEGLTVAKVRAQMKEACNIPNDAKAFLGGVPIDGRLEGSTLIGDATDLTFQKEAGQKGNN